MPAPHVPAICLPTGTSQIGVEAPASRSILFNRVSRVKAMDRPSGDQKIDEAPSVPGIGLRLEVRDGPEPDLHRGPASRHDVAGVRGFIREETRGASRRATGRSRPNRTASRTARWTGTARRNERSAGEDRRAFRDRSHAAPIAAAAARPAAARIHGRAARDGGRERTRARGAEAAFRVGEAIRRQLDLEGEVARRGVPAAGLLGQAPLDDPRDVGGDPRLDGPERRGLVAHDGGERLRGGGPVKGRAAREHFVEDRPERELVRAKVERGSTRLLRRHVRDGPEDDPLGSLQPVGRRQVRLRLGRLVRQLGEPEVGDLRVSRFREQHVLGLQVAVNDPLLVRRGEARGDLPGQVQRSAEGQGAAGELLPKAPSLDDLGDEVEGLALVPDVEDGDDVRIGQRGGGPRLPLEPRDALGMAGEGLGKDLDRDRSPEPRVPRAVDLAHPARAERRKDLIGTEPRA